MTTATTSQQNNGGGRSFPVHEHLLRGDSHDVILASELKNWLAAWTIPEKMLPAIEAYLRKIGGQSVALWFRHGGRTTGWRGVHFGQVAVSRKKQILDYKYMELLKYE